MPIEERRDADGSDRRSTTRGGGRRAADHPLAIGWSTRDLADVTGMSTDFIVDEIQAGELKASKFGREYRIADDEARRYLREKGFPLPELT